MKLTVRDLINTLSEKGYVIWIELPNCTCAELVLQKDYHDPNNLTDWEKKRLDRIDQLIKEKQS